MHIHGVLKNVIINHKLYSTILYILWKIIGIIAATMDGRKGMGKVEPTKKKQCILQCTSANTTMILTKTMCGDARWFWPRHTVHQDLRKRGLSYTLSDRFTSLSGWWF